MKLLKQEDTTINIKATKSSVISTYLSVYLAKERLTGRQLDVTTLLVTKYAEYVNNGVKEPYASSLLFSTETRKEIYEKLKISAQHLNNTFKPLIEKGIMAEEDGKFFINPNILPSKKLVFNFSINAK